MTIIYHNLKQNRRSVIMTEIKASMAGSVWKIAVSAGEQVEEDQDIVILESMKMEIPIPAEEGGTVKELKVAEGDFVNEGDVIAIME
ncbi:acetyl-CoA carboxylase biotin carboxyl carrier protein subunit [Virgibacillus siamensis]